MLKFKKKYLTKFLLGLALLIAIGLFIWYLLGIKHVDNNPFSAQLTSSTSFTLYYPTSLPSGYHIDVNSIATPQSGVIVFTISNPKGDKIYVSEETRPITFNLGGYYKGFTNLKETVTSRGTIAVGLINQNQTEIGSLAINKTWILANTNVHIPLTQLTSLLASLTKAN